MRGILFFSVETYIRYKNKECFLFEPAIHTMDFKTEADFEKCKQWCTDQNERCGGFSIYSGVCYFKKLGCRFNLKTIGETSTFIKQPSEVYQYDYQYACK